MINLLVLLSILFIFVEYDLVLRIGRVLNRDAPILYSEYILWRAVDRIFALIRWYRGFTLDIEDRVGEDLPERFILVANHQSIVDIPLVGFLFRGRRMRFVAKKELGHGLPLVSQALRMQGHCLVTRRGDPGQALKALDRYARRCRETGACPVIFPEGTRSRDGSLGHFHVGGLKRTLAAGSIPLVVVALDGGWRIRGLRAVMKNLRGSGYRVRIAGVIAPPHGRQEIMEAVTRSRALVAEALADWRGGEASQVG
jgi:1-acyl-sn-glycerol-3-phosphate acyltransferase